MKFRKVTSNDRHKLATLPANEYVVQVKDVQAKNGESYAQTLFMILNVIEGEHKGALIGKSFKLAYPYFIENLLKDFELPNQLNPSPLEALKKMVGQYAFATIKPESKGWVVDMVKAIPEAEGTASTINNSKGA